MPPKEAPPKGPTIEEFEEDWKRKVHEWEREERQLLGAVDSAVSENAFLVQKVTAAKKDVERLRQQCAEVLRLSEDRQMHLFHQSKAAADAIERDQQTIAKQTADVEQLTAKIGQQKQEVKHRASAVEHALAAHHHHISIVQKRSSLTSMLKERLVKLRSEHVQVEAKLRSALKLNNKNEHVAHSEQQPRAHVASLALIVGFRTALSDVVAHRLRDAFGFDVRHITLPSTASRSECPNSTLAAPIIEPHPACFALGSGGPAVTYVEPGCHEKNAIADPATAFLDHFSTAVMQMSRGQHREQRAIVSVAGNIAPGCKDSDSLQFLVRATRIEVASEAAHADGASASRPHKFTAAVVAVKDLISTLCGPLCTQRNILVILELRDPGSDGRLLVIFTPDSPRPVVLRAAPSADGAFEFGASSGLAISALASLLSGPCTWRELSAERLTARLELELCSDAFRDSGWTVAQAASVPRWAGDDWPQPSAESLCSRPVSRVLSIRPATATPARFILPEAETPALTSLDVTFCTMSFFTAGSACGLAAAAAEALVGSLGTVVSVDVAKGAATSAKDRSAQFADILVSSEAAGLAADAIQAALSQQHRLAHAGFDPAGPGVVVSSSHDQGDSRIIRVERKDAGSRRNSGSLQDHASCSADLMGSDRLQWEREHRPYVLLEACLQGLSDALPDDGRCSVVTMCTAVVRCPTKAAFVALLRQSTMLASSAVASVHDGAAVAVYPSFAPLASYAPLRQVEVGGSLHRYALTKLGPYSLRSQSLLCLVVMDGEKSVGVHEQHSAVHAAAAYLSARVPVARSTVFLHVDLAAGLSCSREELLAITSSPPPRGASPDAASESTSSQLKEKRLTWRKLMQLLPQSAVDFLANLTYPCLVVSSPCLQAGERSLLVVPRSLQTLCPITRKCLFSAATIITATTVFAQEILWQLAPQKADATPQDNLQHPALASWLIM
jgi:hypothetical protein